MYYNCYLILLLDRSVQIEGRWKRSDDVTLRYDPLPPLHCFSLPSGGWGGGIHLFLLLLLEEEKGKKSLLLLSASQTLSEAPSEGRKEGRLEEIKVGGKKRKRQRKKR